jgi:hypothetical protein
MTNLNENYVDFIKNLQSIPNIKTDSLRYILNNNMLTNEGLILEFGTWKGQSLDMISDFTTNNVYGFDSFEGDSEQWEDVDMRKFSLNGQIPTKVKQLNKQERFKTTDVIKDFNKNVKFLKGYFQDTLKPFLNEKNKKITFMHIDSDTYSSTKTIFDECNNYISPECIIVFDELVNYKGFENGECKAFYEWVSNNNIKFEWIGMNGKTLTFNEIDIINKLIINNDYTIYNNKIDWWNKARILNINVSVAVKIILNPNFIY